MYKLDATKEEISAVLKEYNYSKVMLQFPDGLLDTFLDEIFTFLTDE